MFSSKTFSPFSALRKRATNIAYLYRMGRAPNSVIAEMSPEFKQFKRCKPSYLGSIEVDESDQNVWKVLLLPPRPPYNKGAFQLKIKFPSDYPFKPPHIRFITPIFHPNIDERGLLCLPVLQSDNWKPAITVLNVLQSLVFLLNEPQPERPIRCDVAEMFCKNRKMFMETANQDTQERAEKRH